MIYANQVLLWTSQTLRSLNEHVTLDECVIPVGSLPPTVKFFLFDEKSHMPLKSATTYESVHWFPALVRKIGLSNKNDVIFWYSQRLSGLTTYSISLIHIGISNPILCAETCLCPSAPAFWTLSMRDDSRGGAFPFPHIWWTKECREARYFIALPTHLAVSAEAIWLFGIRMQLPRYSLRSKNILPKPMCRAASEGLSCHHRHPRPLSKDLLGWCRYHRPEFQSRFRIAVLIATLKM